MTTLSKTLVAAMTLLSLGAGLAMAQSHALQVPAAPRATETRPQAVQVDYDEDEDDDGWFGKQRHGGEGKRHGRHGEGRDDDEDEAGGCRQGSTASDGRCQMGAGAPPANGLFQGNAAPKAQVN